MRKTLYSQGITKLAMVSALRTVGTANGTAIDTNLFGNSFRTALFIIVTGAITDGSHACRIEDSLDGSTGWVNVDPGTIQGTLPTIVSTDDDTAFEVGVVPQKRFLRLVVQCTGGATGGVYSAVCLTGSGRVNPPVRS